MILYGKQVAEKIYHDIKQEIIDLKPKLSVILVGKDEPSSIYVKKKQEMCESLGIKSELHYFPDCTQKELIEFILFLNKTDTDGILIQLPLPNNIDKNKVLSTICPEKDVDCFHPINVGRLNHGILKPCTPSGVIEMLKHYKIPTSGSRITIINRSMVVGSPLSSMLVQEPYNATVTVCHEHTKNLFHFTKYCDILITAVGKYPDFHLPEEAISPECTVIDVAMNRIDGRLVGDVVNEDAYNKAKNITARVGGVGPTTIACLMRNTVLAAKAKKYENGI